MNRTPKVTATVTVTIDRGNGEVSTVTETRSKSPAVLPVTLVRERAEAHRAIRAAVEPVLDRMSRKP